MDMNYEHRETPLTFKVVKDRYKSNSVHASVETLSQVVR